MSRRGTASTSSRLADALLLAGATLSLLVLSYFIYNYYWTAARAFTGPLGRYVYYGIPTLLGISLLAAIRLPPPAKVRLALTLCSTAIAVYGFGIAATLWIHMPSVAEFWGRRVRSRLAAAAGTPFDPRKANTVVDDLRARGMEAVQAIYPTHLLKKQPDGTLKSPINIDGISVLPLAGIANTLTVVCNEGGQFLTYTSDEHGFNNPHNLWTRPVDVLAVGDSFVQGQCVRPDDNMVAHIRTRYPATVAAGIGGNGPLAMLATLKEYGANVRPRVVLWFFYEGNDIQELYQESQSPLLQRYLAGRYTQNLFTRQAAIDAALAAHVESAKRVGTVTKMLEELSTARSEVFGRPNSVEAIIKLSDLRNRLGLVGGKGLAPSVDTDAAVGQSRAEHMSDGIDLFSRILVEARRTIDEWGGRLYFVYLPSWDRYAVPEGGGNPNRRAVLDVVTHAGLPLIDIAEAFSAHADPLALFPWGIGYHYNEDGYHRVADEVLRVINVVN